VVGDKCVCSGVRTHSAALRRVPGSRVEAVRGDPVHGEQASVRRQAAQSARSCASLDQIQVILHCST
jgi:hypothetical protein